MRRLLLILGLAFALVGVAGADVLTFDNLPATTYGSPIPNGYGGLGWSNFYYLTTSIYPYNPSGYLNGTVSGTNVAYNAYGNAAQIISGPTFVFNSAYFTGAWNDGLQVEVQGYLNGNKIASSIFTVNTSGPSFETFGWTVDHLYFSASGGTFNSNFPYGNGGGPWFAMDNFNYTPAVPEPASMVLLGSGLLALGRKLRRS